MSNLYTNYIAPGSVLVPLAIGIWRYRETNTGHRFLLCMLAFSALSTITAKIFAVLYHNNIIVNQIYTVGEFLFLAGFFYFQFQSIFIKRIIIAMTLLFTIFSICLIVVFIGVVRYDDYAPSVESLLLIFLSIVLFNKNNDSLSNTAAWHKNPLNWFNTGILLYFSGSLFIFLLINYVANPYSLLFRVVWNIQLTFLLMLSLLFAVGFCKIKKERDTITNSQSL